MAPEQLTVFADATWHFLHLILLHLGIVGGSWIHVCLPLNCIFDACFRGDLIELKHLLSTAIPSDFEQGGMMAFMAVYHFFAGDASECVDLLLHHWRFEFDANALNSKGQSSIHIACCQLTSGYDAFRLLAHVAIATSVHVLDLPAVDHESTHAFDSTPKSTHAGRTSTCRFSTLLPGHCSSPQSFHPSRHLSRVGLARSQWTDSLDDGMAIQDA